MKELYINIAASKTLQKPRSSGLLGPTTGGGHSSVKDVDELQTDLCDFIVEIRKENGEQYPSSSMYDLISGLSLYLEREHGFTNKLVSGAFRPVRNTLDNVMKERTAEGGGQRGTPSWKNMSKYCGRRVY